MRNQTLFTILALICLMGSISIAAAQVTKIGTGHNPAIYGSKVAWSDGAGNIHVYNLTTKKDTKILSYNASHPAIYGKKLVWLHESSGKPGFTVYDILSGARSYITQNVDQYSIPAIYGNRIVWSSNGDVYMRDISTSKQSKIATGDNPNIYDTKITYTYDSGDRPQVYVYDVATHKTLKTSSGGDLYNPHIYGNKVIWSDFYTRLGYISMYDLATKKIIAVTSDNVYSGDPNNPDAGDDTGFCNAIYGDKIVYAKISNDLFGNAGVWVYSISTGQSTPVFNYASGVYTTPAIHGTTVVWGLEEGYGNNPVSNNSIYVCDLAAKPVASFTANKVSGIHPLPVTFTYTGTGGGTPNLYHWDFGDKNTSSHALVATHKFAKAGTYTVSLTVTNAAGSSTARKTGYIKIS